PCESTPRRLAHTSTSATVAASPAVMPLATKMSVTKCASATWSTRISGMGAFLIDREGRRRRDHRARAAGKKRCGRILELRRLLRGPGDPHSAADAFAMERGGGENRRTMVVDPHHGRHFIARRAVHLRRHPLRPEPGLDAVIDPSTEAAAARA